MVGSNLTILRYTEDLHFNCSTLLKIQHCHLINSLLYERNKQEKKSSLSFHFDWQLKWLPCLNQVNPPYEYWEHFSTSNSVDLATETRRLSCEGHISSKLIPKPTLMWQESKEVLRRDGEPRGKNHSQREHPPPFLTATVPNMVPLSRYRFSKYSFHPAREMIFFLETSTGKFMKLMGS